MGLRQRHLFRLDPEHDVIYILMEQTQNERGRIRAAFRKMVYDAFLRDHWSARQVQSGKKRAGCRLKKKGYAARSPLIVANSLRRAAA